MAVIYERLHNAHQIKMPKSPRSGCLAVLLLAALGSSSRALPDDAVTPGVEVFVTGLEIPWALGFASDGRIFVTERPGRIRVIDRGKLLEKPWATLPVANWRAAGLSGIAIDPDFERNGFVYVVATMRTGDDRFENRIYRFVDEGETGGTPTLIVGGLESIDTHAGGAFGFGPDGKLYIAMGDGERIDEVQDMASTTGKILRLNPDGSIPGDNPFPGSPVYALGLRNPQGFAWHPDTAELFATEHGPSGFEAEGGREDQDELNVILPRGNYGWPDVSGMSDDDRFIGPLIEWTPAIAPSGLAVVADRESPCYSNFFVAALGGQQLRRVVIERGSGDAGRWHVAEDVPLLEREYGRLRAAVIGPDDYLYFTSSNRNTPGEPVRDLAREMDDKIYRMSPESFCGR